MSPGGDFNRVGLVWGCPCPLAPRVAAPVFVVAAGRRRLFDLGVLAGVAVGNVGEDAGGDVGAERVAGSGGGGDGGDDEESGEEADNEESDT